jgi:hypothetical protein
LNAKRKAVRLSPLAAFNVLHPESHSQERVAQDPQDVERAWRIHWLEFVLPLVVVGAASAIVLLSIAFKIQNLNLADLFEGWILAFPMRWIGATPIQSGLPNSLKPFSHTLRSIHGS